MLREGKCCEVQCGKVSAGGEVQSKVVECWCSHTRFACPQGTARIQVAEPLTARCPLEGKCWRGACKKGSRNWAAKYHAEDLLPTVSPNHPPSQKESLKMAPK